MKFLGTILISLLLVISAFAGERNAKGIGTLSAKGKGVVKFMGSGKIDISGTGKLWIADCSTDNNLEVDVAGAGSRTETPAFIYGYKGFDGTASIRGGIMKLVFTGKGKITVSGKGKLLLKGVGTYKQGDQEIPWSEDTETEIIVTDVEVTE